MMRCEQRTIGADGTVDGAWRFGSLCTELSQTSSNLAMERRGDRLPSANLIRGLMC